MKRYVLVMVIAVFAACSPSGESEKSAPSAPAPAMEAVDGNKLEELWMRSEGAGSAGDLNADNAACAAVKNLEAQPLIQLKGYIDCMVAKGWQQNAEAWARESKRRTQAAGR